MLVSVKSNEWGKCEWLVFPDTNQRIWINKNYKRVMLCMHAKSLQSYLTLCNPIDGSPPGSSVPGILQARILKWITISFSNACMHAKSLQSCLTLCNPMDSGPTGSPVPGILQARTLELVAISFSNAWKWKVKVKLLGVATPPPGDLPIQGSNLIIMSPVLAGGIFTITNTWEAHKSPSPPFFIKKQS